MSRIAIIGGGAWGTALAIVLGRKAIHNIQLWSFEYEVCASIVERRTNEIFFCPAAAFPTPFSPPPPSPMPCVTPRSSSASCLRIMCGVSTRRCCRTLSPGCFL